MKRHESSCKGPVELREPPEIEEPIVIPAESLEFVRGEDGSFTCLICQKKFNRKSNLKRHKLICAGPSVLEAQMDAIEAAKELEETNDT